MTTEPLTAGYVAWAESVVISVCVLCTLRSRLGLAVSEQLLSKTSRSRPLAAPGFPPRTLG
jgi:hypothetical protein